MQFTIVCGGWTACIYRELWFCDRWSPGGKKRNGQLHGDVLNRWIVGACSQLGETIGWHAVYPSSHSVILGGSPHSSRAFTMFVLPTPHKREIIIYFPPTLLIWVFPVVTVVEQIHPPREITLTRIDSQGVKMQLDAALGGNSELYWSTALTLYNRIGWSARHWPRC